MKERPSNLIDERLDAYYNMTSIPFFAIERSQGMNKLKYINYSLFSVFGLFDSIQQEKFLNAIKINDKMEYEFTNINKNYVVICFPIIEKKYGVFLINIPSYQLLIEESEKNKNEVSFVTSHFEKIFDQLPCLTIWVNNEKNPRILYMNQEAFSVFGYENRDDFIERGKNLFYYYVHEEDLVLFYQHREFEVDEIKNLCFRIVNNKQEVRWLNGFVTYTKSLKGNLCYEFVGLDVTTEKNKEIENKALQEKLNVAFDHINMLVWEVDIKKKRSIQYLTDGKKIYENIPYSVVSNNLVADDSKKDFIEIHKKIFKGEKEAEADICFTTSKGKLWKHIVYKTIFDGKNRACYAVGSATDIGRLKDTENKYSAEVILRHKAEVDELTKINTTAAFIRKTKELLQINRKSQFVFVYMNIYHFSVINELYGISVGDEILVKIAGIIKNVVDTKGTYCRYGGNEFMFVCNADLNYLSMISQINKEVSLIEIDNEVELRTGIYISEFDTELTVELMCSRATMAAKNNPHVDKNINIYDDDLRTKLLYDKDLCDTMPKSLENRDFLLYIQPKVDMQKKTIVGGEALVRWMHPSKGLIPPNDFISLFEKNGLINKLDMYMWEETIKVIRDWINKGLEPVPVSVNVSRVDLYNLNFRQIINDLVNKYDVSPSLIELEITESVYTDQNIKIAEIISELQSDGFSIAMDDFGSGYSSLNMLKDLPIDILKLDLRFLKGIDDNSCRSTNILISVIKMAQGLDLKVVAEGVETAPQMSFLLNNGCLIGQGFLYSKPIPVDEFEKMLINNEI